MHAVPEDFTLEHLIGRTLTAVSMGPYDLHFLFAPKDDILCVGKVEVEVGGTSIIVMNDGSFGDTSVLSSVAGRQVLNWRIEASHEFSLSLTGDMKIHFISTDSKKEDFVIFPGVQVV
jgi:hypothetical protein